MSPGVRSQASVLRGRYVAVDPQNISCRIDRLFPSRQLSISSFEHEFSISIPDQKITGTNLSGTKFPCWQQSVTREWHADWEPEKDNIQVLKFSSSKSLVEGGC